MKKLKSSAGETLAESLAAILIFTFASILLLTLVCTADDLNQMAAAADREFWEQQRTAELAEGTGAGGIVTITVNGASEQVDVEIYGERLYTFYMEEGQ